MGIDDNECSTSNGGCQQTCINTAGSFHCDCRCGYSLNSNGRTCTGTIVEKSHWSKRELYSPYFVHVNGNHVCTYVRPSTSDRKTAHAKHYLAFGFMVIK